MSTRQEKQRRGFLTSFYKSSTRNHKPNAVTKQQVSLPKTENLQQPPEEGGREGGGGKVAAAAMVEGSRKSVSCVENNIGSVASFLQVKVLVTDMPGFMQVHAFRCARTTYDSFHKFSSKHMAYNIKKEFDKVYGPAWHCIVGSSFGSFVTHSTGCFLYFSMEKLYILIFKTKVEKALN